jgi:hypothetical protein
MHPFRVPPAVGQFSHDAGGCALIKLAFCFVHNGGGGSSDACDVLQSEPARTASIGDVEDVEEQAGSPAVEAVAAAGNGKILAGEACNDAIHQSSKLRCWEFGEIAAPYRRWR